MSTMIQFSNVEKSFGKKRALKDVSFSVEAGKIFGFLGPNGAGKTTSIRCMLGFIAPDSGKIVIDGLDGRKDSAELKRVLGYLPADDELYDHWTGRDHIMFLSKVRGVQYDDALVRRLDFDDTKKVKHLSTGNRQKLGIIIALLGSPKLLILDEPTRGLDPMLQNQLYEILEEFRRGGGTVFMSSHNLAEIEKVCDSIVVIRDGELIVEETLESLRKKSIHHVNVTFTEPVPRSIFKVAAVQVRSVNATNFSLRVKGDLTPVMRLIAKHRIGDLEVNHASLEEIFMELYK